MIDEYRMRDQIVCGGDHTCLMLSTGMVRLLGNNRDGQCNVPDNNGVVSGAQAEKEHQQTAGKASACLMPTKNQTLIPLGAMNRRPHKESNVLENSLQYFRNETRTKNKYKTGGAIAFQPLKEWYMHGNF